MNELIQLHTHQLGENNVQTVNARELHAFLEVGKVFAAWIQERITQFDFVDGQDYVVTVSKTGIRQNVTQKDYHLTLDMAKELSMVERNAKGKQARQYFIECERRVKSVTAPAIPQTLPEALRLAADLAEQKSKAEAALAIAAPKAEALDRISASDEAVTMTQAAKLLGIKRETLTNYLHANGWVYRQNGAWVAYDQHIKNGRLQFKEARYTDQKTGQEHYSPYCHILPKGLALLARHFAAKEAA